MKKISNFLVSKNDQSKRIDIYINSQKKELSRTRIKNLILKEKLKLNNKIIKIPSYKVSIGDKIDFSNSSSMFLNFLNFFLYFLSPKILFPL